MNHNQITALDLTNNILLRILNCTGNLIETLVLSPCVALQQAYLDNDLLSTLIAESLPDLAVARIWSGVADSRPSLVFVTLKNLPTLAAGYLLYYSGGWHTNNSALWWLLQDLIAVETLDISDNAAFADPLTLTPGTLTQLNASGCPLMPALDVRDNALTVLNIAGDDALLTLYAQNNYLDESSVDAILAQLDGAGLSNGTVDVSGASMAVPSGAGLASKSSLEGRGWTVTAST